MLLWGLSGSGLLGSEGLRKDNDKGGISIPKSSAQTPKPYWSPKYPFSKSKARLWRGLLCWGVCVVWGALWVTRNDENVSRPRYNKDLSKVPLTS